MNDKLWSLGILIGVLLIVGSLPVATNFNIHEIAITYDSDQVDASYIDDPGSAEAVSDLPPKTQAFARETIRNGQISVTGHEVWIFEEKVLTITNGPAGWHLGKPAWGDPFQEHSYFQTPAEEYYRATVDRDAREKYNSIWYTATGIGMLLVGSGLVTWSTLQKHASD